MCGEITIKQTGGMVYPGGRVSGEVGCRGDRVYPGGWGMGGGFGRYPGGRYPRIGGHYGSRYASYCAVCEKILFTDGRLLYLSSVCLIQSIK